ncbi:MAG: A/G-specific adenine glycosylase [Bacillus sp. (in: Bacteria)]|nr:A/G-specific adenine glycosylase [Bacillus sp. (in: firmicutes)]MCM1426884.1 A/G-specific adenine glycosylase [Eubacterium sp.]
MLEKIVKPLLAWYDKGKRILPWRQFPTPYHVWVSEIMLQQTRVEAVKPYYDRFMQELPDIQALAETDEEKLLKLWEGLGYYNRARNLKKAADKIVIEYDGRMPDSYEELIKLPGIGSYTAGAIASIAFGRPYPAVDGNVLRILARLRLDERNILDAGVKRALEAEVLQIMPGDRPGDFNQALMELGAVVCIPNGTAKCGICPLAALCEAARTERVAEFPKKASKKQRSIEEKTVLVIRQDDKVALRKRQDKGLLAGMYEFPSMDGTQTAGRVLAYIKSMGMMPLKIEKLTQAKHIFTHKEWHMTGFLVRIDELEKKEPANELFFATLQELEEKYPVPSAFSAYMQFLGTQGRSV